MKNLIHSMIRILEFPLISQNFEFESGYFKSPPSTGFFCIFEFFLGKCLHECPLFFWKHDTSRKSQKFIHFSPGGPRHQHFTPWMWANTGNIRYFEKWSDFEEKVERQGKGDQSVCNEHNYAHISPWVLSIACRVTIRVPKLEIFKNDP